LRKMGELLLPACWPCCPLGRRRAELLLLRPSLLALPSLQHRCASTCWLCLLFFCAVAGKNNVWLKGSSASCRDWRAALGWMPPASAGLAAWPMLPMVPVLLGEGVGAGGSALRRRRIHMFRTGAFELTSLLLCDCTALRTRYVQACMPSAYHSPAPLCHVPASFWILYFSLLRPLHTHTYLSTYCLPFSPACSFWHGAVSSRVSGAFFFAFSSVLHVLACFPLLPRAIPACVARYGWAALSCTWSFPCLHHCLLPFTPRPLFVPTLL